MTVQFTEAGETSSTPGRPRPTGRMLVSSGLWVVSGALLVLASTRDVWTFQTAWPTGNGVTSGRVKIAYDAWGAATVTNLSDSPRLHRRRRCRGRRCSSASP